MFNIILPTFFIALTSATRLQYRADEFGAKHSTQAVAVPTAGTVHLVTVTDFTTIYSTPSQATVPSAPSSVPTVDSKQSSVSPSVALGTSLIPYGSGLPGPSPSSAGSVVVSKAPVATSSVCTACHHSNMARPPTQIPTFTIDPSGIPVAPSATPSPFNKSVASSSKPVAASSAAPVAPASSAVSVAPKCPAASNPTPTPTLSSMAAKSTAIVIVPTSLPVVQARSFDWSTKSISIAAHGFDKRQDDESTSTSTTTIRKIIVTSRLPSSTLRVSRSSAKSAVSSTTNVKTTSKPASTLTPKPSKTDSIAVVTSVVSGDDRCPYPYPGAHCGGPLTTLMTQTKSDKPTSTKKQEPEASGDWCPYPGQKC